MNGRVTALVRVATDLTEDQMRALHAVLERYFRRPLHLEVEVEASILGGVWVRVGDTVVDGSLRGRLETLRHHMRVQSRALITGPLSAPHLATPPVALEGARQPSEEVGGL